MSGRLGIECRFGYCFYFNYSWGLGGEYGLRREVVESSEYCFGECLLLKILGEKYELVDKVVSGRKSCRKI